MNNETRAFLENLTDALKMQAMSAQLLARSLELAAQDETVTDPIKSRLDDIAQGIARLDNRETVEMLEAFLAEKPMNEPPQDSRYITRKEYAAKHHITERTVDRRIKEGRLKTRRLFGRVLIDTKNSPCI